MAKFSFNFFFLTLIFSNFQIIKWNSILFFQQQIILFIKKRSILLTSIYSNYSRNYFQPANLNLRQMFASNLSMNPNAHLLYQKNIFNIYLQGLSIIEYLYCLLNDYSDKFDFHFVNSSLMKTLYEFKSDLIKILNIHHVF